MRVLTLPEGGTTVRLDVFLSRSVPGCSRRTVQHAIAAGAVRVNGRRARKGAFVGRGDRIEVADHIYAPPVLQPNTALTMPVLYEDDAVIAVDKPAGVPSHALRADETLTVANFLLGRHPEVRLFGRPLEGGLVHRLDTDTSGVLLAARSAVAYTALRRQFKTGQVIKQYAALVHGDIAESGEVCVALVHRSGDRRMMQVCPHPNPGEKIRPALTRYRPLERFGTVTLLDLRIPTGVMHQIRVHLASIGHPIVGDRLYGGDYVDDAPRQLLHADAVEFRHPVTGRPVHVRSATPADFRAFVDSCRELRPERDGHRA